VAALAEQEASHPLAAAVLPVVQQTPPYVHFDRDETGRLSGVRHRREGDAMPDTGTSDAGLFALSAEAFHRWLPVYAGLATVGARTGERNFLPFLPWLAARAAVESFEIPAIEAQGINSPEDLAAIERWLETGADRS
jgi:bifunctional UDP-N-acetylglucosamine pyrophosphorylase / glucosamine-1-phosphate N-acetyltransferase